MYAVRCFCRPELDEREYWLALYKLTSGRTWPFYWKATYWLDDSKATYRDWSDDYEQIKYANCITYTSEGWIDHKCSDEHYFTCKKDAGTPTPRFVLCITFSDLTLLVGRQEEQPAGKET